MQICYFPQWQELETWLATNENFRFNLWKWPIGGSSEDLSSEYCRAYFNYVDIWERICDSHASEADQTVINRAILFGREPEEIPMTTLKSGKVLFRSERKNRVELSLDANANISDFWSALDFALKPQSVREMDETMKNFEIGDYKERFHTVRSRGFLFGYFDDEDAEESFEDFRSYYASWRACFAEAAQKNYGLLVFGW